MVRLRGGQPRQGQEQAIAASFQLAARSLGFGRDQSQRKADAEDARRDHLRQHAESLNGQRSME